MAKKIAVLLRDRQEEALRVAVGLIMLDDKVDVYVLDRIVEPTEQNKLYLETMDEFEIDLYTNFCENKGMTCLTNDELAERLLGYDTVLPY